MQYAPRECIRQHARAHPLDVIMYVDYVRGGGFVCENEATRGCKAPVNISMTLLEWRKGFPSTCKMELLSHTIYYIVKTCHSIDGTYLLI